MRLKQILAITFLSLLFLFQPGIFMNAAEKPAVDPRANEILKQMGEYLKTADQFTFYSEVYFEQVLASGQKLQYSSLNDVAIQRPNRLRVHSRGDDCYYDDYYNRCECDDND